MSGLLAIVNARFQNISCYCLSTYSPFFITWHGKFQNISCYCLSHPLLIILCLSSISKHLMLLFIAECRRISVRRYGISKHLMLLFISCNFFSANLLYPISKHLMLLFILFPLLIKYPLSHFKTSHVIVYPYLDAMPESVSPFQNISCYCLSIGAIGSAIGGGRFQNISCYCLSLNPKEEYGTDDYFKTSHVIVYLKEFKRLKKLIIFQNISCYCLSTPPCINSTSFHISKHLMLLFIEYTWNLTRFLFDYFKTSHVIVYLF